MSYAIHRGGCAGPLGRGSELHPHGLAGSRPGSVESGLDTANELPSRVGTQLDRYSRTGTAGGIDEVDVQRMLKRCMEGVVEPSGPLALPVISAGTVRYEHMTQASDGVRYMSNQEKIRCHPSNAASGR